MKLTKIFKFDDFNPTYISSVKRDFLQMTIERAIVQGLDIDLDDIVVKYDYHKESDGVRMTVMFKEGVLDGQEN